MATEGKNLSDFNPDDLPDLTGKKFGIVVSEWNHNITENLLKGALQGFYDAGVLDSCITIKYVPGAYELALGALNLIQSGNIDGVVCLGSVIRGETAHFDFVCQAAAQGIMEVNLKTGKPVAFGVLTDDNEQQALDRSGGRHGNKGTEAAVVVMKMQ
ncbi:MAG: 6,7-dimethyl-8-ribityllumazine synthase [Flavobacteriales bacterium]